MAVKWDRPNVAKNPIRISSVPSARPVRLLDARRDFSKYWVTPDTGSCPSRDGPGRVFWDHAVRRELRKRPGWLGKAINPFLHSGKERAAAGQRRWDLVVQFDKNEPKFKLARLLCKWENEEGDVMSEDEQDGLEVDHIQGGKSGQSPCDYRLCNLRPLDVPSHRQLQPPRGTKRKRPAASLLRRPA